MSKINDGGPAFPSGPALPFGDGMHEGEAGMSLRDWFAGQALAQGMAVLVASSHNLNEYQLGQLAKTAYFAADAMLAARTKGGA